MVDLLDNMVKDHYFQLFVFLLFFNRISFSFSIPCASYILIRLGDENSKNKLSFYAENVDGEQLIHRQLV